MDPGFISVFIVIVFSVFKCGDFFFFAGLQRLSHILPRPEPAAQQRLPLPSLRHTAVPGRPGAERPLQPDSDPLPAAQRLGTGRQHVRLRVQDRHGVQPGKAESDG